MPSNITTMLIGLSCLFSAITVSAQMKTVRVGITIDLPPFSYIEHNQPQGFEIDVWNEIAKRNQYYLILVPLKKSQLFNKLDEFEIDTISNEIAMTNERMEKYLFSDPYVINGAQIVVRSHPVNDDIKSIEDLDAKRVAIDETYEKVVREFDRLGRIERQEYDFGIADEVAKGEGHSDAFILNRVSAIHLIKSQNLPLKLAGQPFEVSYNAWPFNRNREGKRLQAEVNRTLTEMRKDNTLKALSNKWFDTDITY